jgi:hypothetical protein
MFAPISTERNSNKKKKGMFDNTRVEKQHGEFHNE